MTTLVAEARARTAAPERLIATFRERMAEYGMPVEGSVSAPRVLLPTGAVTLRPEGAAVALRLEAGDAEGLAGAKATVSENLDAFAPGEALGIAWVGDGAESEGARPHNFRAVRVVRAVDLTPRMRRVTLAGEDLHRFDAAQMHLKILIPAAGAEPAWPRLDAGGRAVFDATLTRRTYTIRRVDAEAGLLDIDFVVHGEGSPGSRFAARARPGDPLGLMGPGGGSPPLGTAAEGWLLIAGDETALPVIGRALEGMAPDARGLVLIEVTDAGEEQALALPPGIALRWLHRDSAPYGTPLLEAVRAAALPEGGAVTCWAACENATARALREHWGEVCGLHRARYRAVAYWHCGVEEDTR